MKKKWIAIYTKSRHEKSVARNLKNKSFEVYLPMLKERRKWSDRKRWVEFPMFRSYVFVRTYIKNGLYILETDGVTKIVHFNQKVAVVKDDDINAIKLILEGGYSIRSEDYFLLGDKVEVKAGPLKGIVGEVIRSDKKDRLVVRVDAIQHSISTHINRSYLRSIT